MRAVIVSTLLMMILVASVRADEPARDLRTLLEELKSSKVKERRQAADLLGKAKVLAAVPALVEALDDDSRSVRIRVACALIDIVPDWRDMLRRGAITKEQAFDCFQLAGTAALELLAALAEDPDAAIATRAVDKLSALDERAIPGILRALHHPHPDVRAKAREGLAWVAYSIGMIGNAQGSVSALVIPALLPLAKDPDPIVRGRALAGIALHGRFDQEIVLLGLRDRDAQVRWVVCDALGRLGDRARLAVMPLTECLNDKDAHVRLRAARALLEIERHAPRVLPTFLAALADSDADVRANAAIVLGTMGLAAVASAPALEWLRWNDSDETVRAEAEDACRKVCERPAQ